jgi:hypothetical protein
MWRIYSGGAPGDECVAIVTSFWLPVDAVIRKRGMVMVFRAVNERIAGLAGVGAVQ